MSESLLDKALEFLGEKTAAPPVATTPEKTQYNPTTIYDQLTEDPLLQANLELLEDFPNLVFEDDRAEEVSSWIRAQEGVGLDIETYGTARRKEERTKEALSFVRGTVRLVQLSSGGEAYTLDATLLSQNP